MCRQVLHALWCGALLFVAVSKSCERTPTDRWLVDRKRRRACQAAAGPNRLAALALALGTHLLDLERVPLSIAALTLGHAFVPPEALAALVARHLALQARARPPGGLLARVERAWP